MTPFFFSSAGVRPPGDFVSALGRDFHSLAFQGFRVKPRKGTQCITGSAGVWEALAEVVDRSPSVARYRNTVRSLMLRALAISGALSPCFWRARAR